MPQYAADIVASRIADQRVVLRVIEDVLAPLPQALVRMHAGAVVLKNRLRHDGYRLPVPAGDVLNDVFVDQDLVGHARECGKAHVDLGLPRRADLVVVNLYPDPTFLQRAHHLRSELLLVIHGRDREITLLVAWLVAEIWPIGLTCVPESFLGVDVVETVIVALVEAHIVQYVEFDFRTPIADICEAGAVLKNVFAELVG